MKLRRFKVAISRIIVLIRETRTQAERVFKVAFSKNIVLIRETRTQSENPGREINFEEGFE